MKSRKKVSRKKTARHKTSTRRSHSRVRSKRQTKRGGMMRSARAVAGTLLYHDILRLLSRAKLNIHLGREPTPDEYAITKENDRYYGTILDIPADDGIKTSIEELRKELENPVKTADKMKSIKEKYDAIMKKLEEEKKKQLAKQEQKLMVVGKSFRPPSYQERLSLVDVGPVAAASGGESLLDKFINDPFTFSPNPQRNPNYFTQKVTPTKLHSKSKLRPQDLEIIGTPHKIQFTDDVGPITSPLFSPPPPHQSANEENKNPQLLLSPGPAVRKITFDE
jgi:hypothetical protein